MPYKLRMVVIASQEALEIYMVQRPTGLQRRGRPLPKPCGLDTRQSFKGGCDGILKVDIVDIGQKKQN